MNKNNDDGTAAIWNRERGGWQPLTELYTAEETEAAAKIQEANRDKRAREEAGL